MRFYHDQEFLEDGRTIEPISIGIVTEDGREYYSVFSDWLLDPLVLHRVRRHWFIMREVVPHLPKQARRIVDGDMQAKQEIEALQHYADSPIKPKWKIATEVEAFIRQYGTDRDQHELWTWYGAYDHVMLAQLWGPMMQLPSCVPMYTNDLKAYVDGMERDGHLKILLPAQGAAEAHDALADARWLKRAHEAALRQTATWLVDAVKPEPYKRLPGGLVAIPERVFVAGYERLESVGPNEGLEPEDEEPCRRLWEQLL